MGYDRSNDTLASETPLPDSVDDDLVRSLIGDYPNLRGDSFPVEGESLHRLARDADVAIREDEVEYFIEYRL